MLKKNILLFCMIGCSILAAGQSSFTTISIANKLQPGLVIHLPDNEAVAEGTILQKLKETGYSPDTKGSLFWKKNKIDGFYVFTGVQLSAMNNQQVDMYFKVERESKTRKDQSIIYLLVSKGYDNYISPDNDSASFAAATDFLNAFVGNTAAYRLQMDIDAQAIVVKKAEKKLEGFKDDEKDIIRKIGNLQTALRNKQSEQQLQQKQIRLEQDKLDQLKIPLSK